MTIKTIALLTIGLLLSLSALGQTFGDISGEVRDSSGAVIGGAQVTLTNVKTNAVRTAISNDAGVYSFPSLQPGVYTIKVEKSGFKTVTRPEVEIQVQQHARIDFELPVGQVTESVEVSASAALLSTENATVGTVIENKRIVELPLNGRNYLQLVSLAPNVSYGFNTAGQANSRQGGQRAQQNIAVGGQRSMFNHFTLDGVENTDPNFNTFVIQPSIDALQEFKVQTGVYPAEFGRAATQINVLTKSGTNQYHGTLFHFLRNDKLDAANYAFDANRPPMDPFKWNQFGYTFGGPVWIPKLFHGRDRLFFMSNYEAFRQRRTVRGRYNLPSVAMREGNFAGVAPIYDPSTRVQNPDGTITAQRFPGDAIPASRIHPVSQRLLEFYPSPNFNPGLVLNNHQIGLGRPINRDQFILRMDFVESSNSQWSGRYSWGDENQLDEGLYLNGFNILTNVEQYMGTNTRVLSPAIVNEFRFGYTRFYNTAGRELAFTRNVVDELAIPGLRGGEPVTWGIPSVSIAGLSGFGDDSEGPYENNNNSLQFINNVSWIRGKHAFKFGGEIRRDQYNQVGNQFARGAFLFENNATRQTPAASNTGHAFADFLLGQCRRCEASISLAQAGFRNTAFYLYADDVWKVTPTLTVSLGLRYERTPPWSDNTGRLISVAIPFEDRVPRVADMSRHPRFIRQGTGEFYEGLNIRWPEIQTIRDGSLGDRLVRTDTMDWAPRLGITWNPSSNWVIRTGAGIFYSQDTGNPRFDLARNLAGRAREEARTDLPDLTWENALRNVAGATAQVRAPYAFANLYDRQTPYIAQYLLNVQRELPGNTLAEIGYLGSVGRHLESLRAVNEALPGLVGSVIDRSPYPEFGRIQLVDASGKSSYNSLGAKLTKRYSSGLTYLASYTWSKSIDMASGIRNHGGDTLFPQNSYCLACERGLSGFNVAHRFVTSALYDLPIGRGRPVDVANPFLNAVIGGWQLGSILTLQTGFPITVVTGTDQSNTGAGFDRPDATGIDPAIPRGEQDPRRFFQTEAFVRQAPGTFGNVGRNTLIGPGIIGWDFSTLKNFPVTESHFVQFRFEAFNFPNHPNWGDPNTNCNSGAAIAGAPANACRANFGTITGTRGNMRQLQFGLKYVF